MDSRDDDDDQSPYIPPKRELEGEKQNKEKENHKRLTI